MADDTGAAPRAEIRAEDTVERVIRHRLAEVLGGWYGSLETALPTVAFVVVWLVRTEIQPALLSAAAVVLILLGIRLRVGGSLRYVLTSVFATAIAAFFALRSGRAEDAFLPGILASSAYGLGALLSILSRWPLVGFLVAMGEPDYAKDPTRWRRDRALVTVCSRLTWVLVALFALRVGIMLPLYLAGEVAWLGVAKVVLGWPAYLLAVVVMALVLALGRTAPTGLADDAPARVDRHDDQVGPRAGVVGTRDDQVGPRDDPVGTHDDQVGHSEEAGSPREQAGRPDRRT